MKTLVLKPCLFDNLSTTRRVHFASFFSLCLGFSVETLCVHFLFIYFFLSLVSALSNFPALAPRAKLRAFWVPSYRRAIDFFWYYFWAFRCASSGSGLKSLVDRKNRRRINATPFRGSNNATSPRALVIVLYGLWSHLYLYKSEQNAAHKKPGLGTKN